MKRREKIERLIKRLSHEKDAVRSSAALSLGSLRAQEAVSALVPKLRDPSREMKRSVAMALILIGGARALPRLMKQLASPDQALRCWSAAVVRKLSGKDFGFKDNATFDAIEEAIPKIRAWWERQKRSSHRKK